MWHTKPGELPTQGCDTQIGWKFKHACGLKPVVVRRFRIMEHGVSCLNAEYFCAKHRRHASKIARKGETDVEVLDFPVQ